MVWHFRVLWNRAVLVSHRGESWWRKYFHDINRVELRAHMRDLFKIPLVGIALQLAMPIFYLHSRWLQELAFAVGGVGSTVLQ